MKLNKYNIAAVMFGLLGSGMTLMSCSDDLGMNSNDINSNSGVTLLIPDLTSAAQFSTKASSEAVGDEGKINDLFLYVFKTEGSNTSFVSCEELTDKTTTSTDGYTRYNLNLEPGTYKLYLLGNTKDYASGADLSKLQSEDAITGLPLTFSGALTADKLPMACLSNLTVNDKATQTFEVGKSAVQVYANLSFLVSKVRYTVLFDNSANGVSSAFGTHVADFDGVSFSNVVPKGIVATPVSVADSELKELNGTISQFDYPTEANYPASEKSLNLTQAATSSSKCAWQGIAYLPENTNAKKTVVTVSGKALTKEGGDEIYAISKDITLCPSDVTNGNLLRSTMYDVVFTVKNYDALDVNIAQVSAWNVDALQYVLNGKPYELVVDQTKIGVGTGEYTDLAYRSDVNVGVESPILGDGFTAKGKSFYQYEVKDDVISIRINSSIPYSDLQKIDNSSELKAQYNYFHVTAGQLRKRIDVNPLNMEPIFEVTPETIVLDVRQMISTGEANPTFPIKYTTNVDDAGMAISISAVSGFGTNDFTSLLGNGISSVLTLKHEDGSNITSSNLGKAEGELVLTSKNILGGAAFWKENHTYTIRFTNNKITDANKASKDVTIVVKPYTSDYVIHFKDNTADWGAPHIYIYQCLELPAQAGTYGGKTVGYKDGEGDDAYLSALEYAFTNDLSFKGWSGYGGTVSTTGSNTSYDHGFVLLNGNNLDFKPGNLKTNIYNFDASHNEAHKANLNANSNGWICLACKEGKYKLNQGGRTYPGIVMEYEGDGWWKYTLTGVATPGKAMIMFSDGHDGEVKDSKYRYPNHSVVGVPLFDFPDNEGWFLYGGNVNGNYSFVDDKPSSSTRNKTGYYNYRFHWPGGFQREWAYLKWFTGNDEDPGWAPNGNSAGWGQIPTVWADDKNWNVYEFGFRSHGTNDFRYSIGGDDNRLTEGNNMLGNLSSFTLQADGWYHGYISETNKTVQGGNPAGNTPDRPSTSKHYLYFQDQSTIFSTPKVHIYGSSDYKTWNDEATKMTPINGAPSGYTGDNKGGNWYQFEIPSGFETANFIIHNNNSAPRSDKEGSGNPNIEGAKFTSGKCTVVYYYNNTGGDGKKYEGWGTTTID